MKKAAVFVALLLCLGMLAGCQKTPEVKQSMADADKVILLGYAQLGSESGWREGNTRSIYDAAQAHGIKLRFENAEQKQSKQIDAIRSFIAYRVDVIAFSPIVADGWDVVLSEAKAAGIPVLLVDRGIETADESLYDCFIGSDFVEEGRAAARFLKRRTAQYEQVRIVEITGTEESTPMKDRYQGFREELGDEPKYQIIDSVSGDFLRSRGKECMKQLLAAHEDIDVLYSHNDSMTLGAVEAIEAAGLVPGKDIVIITVDGEQKAIDLLKQGKINCVVECTPMLGETVMQLTERLVAGETIDRVVYSNERTFSEYDDDLESLAPRGY
ncbi:MAG: ABC transporter substrate-binding protein [Clostridia bacterium]